ncbi:histidinol-phosphate transaminase [Aquabacterium sp. A7-Y]|uniref:histidinol-phosphate transaminase n=1 Tax=Aquabacterium sp. A7-Y TaxID=1349605 RepID=UPI00223CA11E|nr:histidinol-phosphate transaminase [Aquabacterium sp. A7-Y]MCW7539596.1 histidinol-phosphate transaminase [Aquabacterium sp. A7-Y]
MIDWGRLVAPEIRQLRPYRPGITEEKLQRERSLSRICKFSSNETPVEPSPAIAAAMQEALRKVNRYPDPQALLDRLASRLQVPAEGLLLGNGSIDVIEAVIRTFVSPGCNVVLSEYGYSAYAPLIAPQGAEVRLAPSGAEFGHQVDRLLERLDGSTRLVILDSPTNLSGAALSLAELDRLVRALPPRVILLLDEAYAEFAGHDPARSAVLPLAFPNVVVARTFSKAYGLAGLRVGYAIADPALASWVQRLRPPFPVNRVALAGALAALDDTGHLQWVVQSARRGKEQLCDALQSFGVPIVRGHANFVLADFAPGGKRIYEGLLAQGLITRAMDAYGLPQHLRISIGAPHEIARLVEALRELLQVPGEIAPCPRSEA